MTCGGGVQQREKHSIFAKKNAESALCKEEEQITETRSCQFLPCRGKTIPKNVVDFEYKKKFFICTLK